MTAKVLTPKEVASAWGISPKTLRKFLRKDEKAVLANGGSTPGKGGRWSIPASSLKSLRKRFDAWVAANAAKTEKASDEVADDEVTLSEEMHEIIEENEDSDESELESH